MSKYVKDLLSQDIKHKLDGVNDALLVSVGGLDAQRNFTLRRELRKKDIHLMVVKNSLVRRATEGTVLAPGFTGLSGLTAVVWGAQDIVALAKEVIRLTKDKQYAATDTKAGFMARGGILDGSPLTAAQVEEVSKWPSREEQLSILTGQILAPGAKLASQLTAASGALASQIEKLGKEKEGDQPPTAETQAAEAPAA